MNWNGGGNSDLFEAYASAAFKTSGYAKVVFTDARLYHDAGGNLHCGTNMIRSAPNAKWWEA